MNKKVLMLSGSPRKGGNSDLLCDQFMLGAKEAGNQTAKRASKILASFGQSDLGSSNVPKCIMIR